jgi:hypothetical protein
MAYLALQSVSRLRIAKLFEIESYAGHYVLSSEVRRLNNTQKLSSCLTGTSFISASQACQLMLFREAVVSDCKIVGTST